MGKENKHNIVLLIFVLVILGVSSLVYYQSPSGAVVRTTRTTVVQPIFPSPGELESGNQPLTSLGPQINCQVATAPSVCASVFVTCTLRTLVELGACDTTGQNSQYNRRVDQLKQTLQNSPEVRAACTRGAGNTFGNNDRTMHCRRTTDVNHVCIDLGDFSETTVACDGSYTINGRPARKFTVTHKCGRKCEEGVLYEVR